MHPWMRRHVVQAKSRLLSALLPPRLTTCCVQVWHVTQLGALTKRHLAPYNKTSSCPPARRVSVNHFCGSRPVLLSAGRACVGDFARRARCAVCTQRARDAPRGARHGGAREGKRQTESDKRSSWSFAFASSSSLPSSSTSTSDKVVSRLTSCRLGTGDSSCVTSAQAPAGNVPEGTCCLRVSLSLRARANLISQRHVEGAALSKHGRLSLGKRRRRFKIALDFRQHMILVVVATARIPARELPQRPHHTRWKHVISRGTRIFAHPRACRTCARSCKRKEKEENLCPIEATLEQGCITAAAGFP